MNHKHDGYCNNDYNHGGGSCQPQDAIRTDAASAESLEAHDATEKETTKPRHQEAHDEHALTHHTLASKEQLTRPANWDSMTRTARNNWQNKQST